MKQITKCVIEQLMRFRYESDKGITVAGAGRVGGYQRKHLFDARAALDDFSISCRSPRL